LPGPPPRAELQSLAARRGLDVAEAQQQLYPAETALA
jgi:hypothetical protein